MAGNAFRMRVTKREDNRPVKASTPNNSLRCSGGTCDDLEPQNACASKKAPSRSLATAMLICASFSRWFRHRTMA